MSVPAWLSDLAFLVDISKHMNVLNIKLQGRDQLINKLFEHLRWSFVCGWDNSNNAIMHIFQHCLQVNLIRPQRMLLLLGSCENIQNSICRSARQQPGFDIISNSVPSNRGQYCRSFADRIDWFAMQHWFEKLNVTYN